MSSPSSIAARLRQMADRIDQSKSPSRSLVAADLRRVIASVDVAPIEEALYGASGPQPPLSDEEGESEDGSSIWWSAFRELGMHDWTPLSDPAVVEAKALELLEKWQPWKGMPEQKKFFDDEVRSVRKNWETYQKNYMPEHVEILKAKGLM